MFRILNLTVLAVTKIPFPLQLGASRIIKKLNRFANIYFRGQGIKICNQRIENMNVIFFYFDIGAVPGKNCHANPIISGMPIFMNCA